MKRVEKTRFLRWKSPLEIKALRGMRRKAVLPFFRLQESRI
jgi:hypothetical protein